MIIWNIGSHQREDKSETSPVWVEVYIMDLFIYGIKCLLSCAWNPFIAIRYRWIIAEGLYILKQKASVVSVTCP